MKACYLGLTSASAPTFKLDLTETSSSSRCRTARSTRFPVGNNDESVSTYSCVASAVKRTRPAEVGRLSMRLGILEAWLTVRLRRYLLITLALLKSLVISAKFRQRVSRFPARCCVKGYETILFSKKKTPIHAGGNHTDRPGDMHSNVCANRYYL